MPYPDAVLETHQLTKDYGHRAVLRQIDLQLVAGQIVGLMGVNGAGKTTLLGCLASIVRPTSGKVLWFGRPATADPSARRWLGMVAHESRLYPHLTLHENLVFSARIYSIDQSASRAERALGEVGLAAHAQRLPTQVSRGMRQRAAVARAMLHEPRVLLLDEPFSGLDADGSDWLMATLKRLRDAGTAVCFSTHDASRAAELSDRIWLLERGRLREEAMCFMSDGDAADARVRTRSRAA